MSKNIEDALEPIIIHIYATGEHVGFIKNAIQKIKERASSMTHAVPYQRYTRIMTQSLIKNVVELLKNSPSKNSISDIMSLATILEGKAKMDMSIERM